ncbi:MAG: hypothetical protein ACW97G_15845 [Candidatus Thorarchaeota archaeon]
MRSRKRTMHIAIIITLTMLVSLVHNTPVDATEPSNVALVYDFGAQTLTVNVSHYVSNTKTHYIENIEIQNNGFSILNRSYVNQSFDWGMYDTFSVSTIVGDNLTVTALCKRGHSVTTWLIVTSTTATNTPPTQTTSPTGGTESPGTPLDAGVAIVAGAAVVIFLIVFFAWLNPDRVPKSLKQLGSRIRPGVDWFGEKLSNIVQQIKTRVPSKE